MDFEGRLPAESSSRDDAITSEAAGGGGDEETSASAPQARLHRERVRPRKQLSPLLVPARDMRRIERLHWLGASFGLTLPLISFWRRSGFLPLYLRQTANDLTAEHTAIMLRPLQWVGGRAEGDPLPGWHAAFVADFSRRYMALLSYEFRSFDVTLALSVMDAACSVVMPGGALGGGAGEGGSADDGDGDGGGGGGGESKAVASSSSSSSSSSFSSSLSSPLAFAALAAAKPLSAVEIALLFTPHDLRRLESYARNLVDWHMILDLLPAVARLFFSGRLGALHVPRLQAATLLALGLQHLPLEAVADQFGIGASQCLALFNKSIRKVSTFLNSTVEAAEAARLGARAAAAGPAAASGAESGSAATASATARGVKRKL